MRKPGVLVVNEHFDGDEVGRAVVVDEPSDVAILVGVDAISLTAVLKTIKLLKHIHFTKKVLASVISATLQSSKIIFVLMLSTSTHDTLNK